MPTLSWLFAPSPSTLKLLSACIHQWIVELGSGKDTVTFKSSKHGTYLGYDSVRAGFVRGSDKPRSFTLVPSEENKNAFFITTHGAVDGEKLIVDEGFGQMIGPVDVVLTGKAPYSQPWTLELRNISKRQSTSTCCVSGPDERPVCKSVTDGSSSLCSTNGSLGSARSFSPGTMPGYNFGSFSGFNSGSFPVYRPNSFVDFRPNWYPIFNFGSWPSFKYGPKPGPNSASNPGYNPSPQPGPQSGRQPSFNPGPNPGPRPSSSSSSTCCVTGTDEKPVCKTVTGSNSSSCSTNNFSGPAPSPMPGYNPGLKPSPQPGSNPDHNPIPKPIPSSSPSPSPGPSPKPSFNPSPKPDYNSGPKLNPNLGSKPDSQPNFNPGSGSSSTCCVTGPDGKPPGLGGRGTDVKVAIVQ
ncbi:hypothetical protein FRC07_013252 [Ceratobasidium sp. 392]|nr:hypothetical protein FRC07_013252 [Ceratobasidium sp. 392]